MAERSAGRPEAPTDEFIKQYPNTVKAPTTAMIRTLRWIQTQKAEEIAAAVPENYYQAASFL